jgi:hypothetical protein
MEELREWDDMALMMENGVLTDEADTIWWDLEKEGKFSSKYMYIFIVNPLARDFHMMDMWEYNFPIK